MAKRAKFKDGFARSREMRKLLSPLEDARTATQAGRLYRTRVEEGLGDDRPILIQEGPNGVVDVVIWSEVHDVPIRISEEIAEIVGCAVSDIGSLGVFEDFPTDNEWDRLAEAVASGRTDDALHLIETMGGPRATTFRYLMAARSAPPEEVDIFG